MRNIFALLLLLLLLGVGWLIATTEGSGPHHFEGKCSECHLGKPRAELFVGSVDRLCLRCHQDEASRSHPSDFFPKRGLPDNFPLFNGRFTCVSCHYAHVLMEGRNQRKIQSVSYPFLLRYRQTGRAFCFQCHRPDNFRKRIDSHGTAIGVAHMEAKTPEVLQLLDKSSRDCLACHDGTISFNTDTGGASWEHARGIGLSHPVGILYTDGLRRSKYKYYPESSLPPELKLVNGRIECITCHDHYSKRKGLLVMDNTGSRMCLSCHEM
ncbi:MAG: hypothetical protein GXO70_09840 [Acidobacteria bacterium]|nr:hypothetical protein [Acidobacteriota bacterium]